MANMNQKHTNSSQFFITMRGEDLEHLDGKHTIFGQVEEGMGVLEKINAQFVDDEVGSKRLPFGVRVLNECS